MLGLALYGYVSKSSKTVLTGSLMSSEETSLLPVNEEDEAEDPENFLDGAHQRVKPVDNDETAKVAAAAGDLSSYWGQQVAFNVLLSSGALKKNSDGTYGGANGYTFGKCAAVSC